VITILWSTLPSLLPTGKQIHQPVVALSGRAISPDKAVAANAVKVAIGDRIHYGVARVRDRPVYPAPPSSA